jgi:hypothetical protein
MTETTVISLRRFRARHAAARLQRLPPSLRSAERARPAVEAIVAYAWERAPDEAAAEPARIFLRLEEFVPPSPAAPQRSGLVHWLYDNLVPEAWESPHFLEPLLRDCIRGA